MYFPIDYDYPLFRPPSEGNSLIFQATLGCSWNQCTFCEMYKTKKFKARKEEELFGEIDKFSGYSGTPLKIFIADGDAFVLSSNKLIRIIQKIKQTIPRVQRVSSYALPKNILSKSIGELKEIQEQGLKIVYVGIETGDNELLKMIHKGETYNSTLDALLMLKEAGIKSSVMIINGLGGKKYSHQHAENSAKLITAAQPEYFSTLVLSFPFGEQHFTQQFPGTYISMNIDELLMELHQMIEQSNLENSIFRSDHASNYLVLKGLLSKDKQEILDKIKWSVEHKGQAGFREEWQRGL